MKDTKWSFRPLILGIHDSHGTSNGLIPQRDCWIMLNTEKKMINLEENVKPIEYKKKKEKVPRKKTPR
jgi:hypothetical protein